MSERARQLYLELMNNLRHFKELMAKYGDDPDWKEAVGYFARKFPDTYSQLYGEWLAQQVQEGNMTGSDAMGSMTSSGGTGTDQFSKYIDDVISQENTQQQQDYETQMRDTSLLSAGSQLSQLGLSTSNVISTGGASSGVTSQAASVNTRSAAALKQEREINKYNQRMSIAKQLISTAGSMASSGIYGAALGAIKHSASVTASAAAHSAYPVLHHNGYGNGTFGQDKNFMAEWNKLPGSY